MSYETNLEYAGMSLPSLPFYQRSDGLCERGFPTPVGKMGGSVIELKSPGTVFADRVALSLARFKSKRENTTCRLSIEGFGVSAIDVITLDSKPLDGDG